jgi:hypothetical protein
MKQWVVLGFVVLLVLLGSRVVVAQPDPGSPTTIGDITGDSMGFYGQTVQIQGIIGEFISTNAFVLTDGVALSNANVLVVNNSGRPLPNSYVKGQEVVVTGRVHPSYSEIFNGSVAAFPSYFDERGGLMGSEMTGSGMVATQDPAMMATPMTEGSTMATQDPAIVATPAGGAAIVVTPNSGAGDMSMTSTMNPYEEDLLAWAYNDMLPDEYDVFTIIELVSVDQLMYPTDMGQ